MEQGREELLRLYDNHRKKNHRVKITVIAAIVALVVVVVIMKIA